MNRRIAAPVAAIAAGVAQKLVLFDSAKRALARLRMLSGFRYS
jgi:hypothetical protein